jgi:hypothetical protein
MDVEVLSENISSEELELFFSDASNYTLFHNPKFLSYHKPEKFDNNIFQIHHLIFRDNTKIIGFVPGYIQSVSDSEGKKQVYRTPFASSFGGLILEKNISFNKCEKIFETLLSYLSHKVSSVFYSPTPEYYSFPEAASINYQHFILRKNGFEIVKDELIFVTQRKVTGDLIKRYNKKLQSELKQVICNGIKIDISDEINEEVYRLLLKSQKRLGGSPTHSLEELIKIQSLFQNQIIVFKAKLNNQIIGAIICFKVNSKVLNTFYIFDDFEYRSHKPNHICYHEVLKFAFENNFDFVDFGPSTFGYVPNYSLIFFKEKFDSLPYLKTFYKKNIPNS